MHVREHRSQTAPESNISNGSQRHSFKDNRPESKRIQTIQLMANQPLRNVTPTNPVIQRLEQAEYLILVKRHGRATVNHSINSLRKPTSEITLEELEAKIAKYIPSPSTNRQAIGAGVQITEAQTAHFQTIKVRAVARIEAAMARVTSDPGSLRSFFKRSPLANDLAGLRGIVLDGLRQILAHVDLIPMELTVGGPSGQTSGKRADFMALATSGFESAARARPISINASMFDPDDHRSDHDTDSNLFHKTWTLVHELSHSVLATADFLTYFKADKAEVMAGRRPGAAVQDSDPSTSFGLLKNADTWAAMIMGTSHAPEGPAMGTPVAVVGDHAAGATMEGPVAAETPSRELTGVGESTPPLTQAPPPVAESHDPPDPDEDA